MNLSPETRASLLVRLKDQADHEAWYQFAEIYRPVVFRLARLRGMQPADAEDLAQQVLASVARSVEHWQIDSSRARFRTWLSRVATNAILNALTRGAPDRGTGDTGVHDLLTQQPAADAEASQFIRLEERREVFRWAARQIRCEYQPATWDAFWLTAVEGRDVTEAARELRLSLGSVYAARSRVMRRLKEKVQEWEG